MHTQRNMDTRDGKDNDSRDRNPLDNMHKYFKVGATGRGQDVRDFLPHHVSGCGASCDEDLPEGGSLDTLDCIWCPMWMTEKNMGALRAPGPPHLRAFVGAPVPDARSWGMRAQSGPAIGAQSAPGSRLG